MAILNKPKLHIIILLSGLIIVNMHCVDLGISRHCLSLLQPYLLVLTLTSEVPHFPSTFLGLYGTKGKQSNKLLKVFGFGQISIWIYELFLYSPRVAGEQNFCDACCINIPEALSRSH